MTGEVGALGPALPGYHIGGGVKMGNPYPLANMIGSFALIGKAQRGAAPGRKWLEPDVDGKGGKLRGKKCRNLKAGYHPLMLSPAPFFHGDGGLGLLICG